MHNTVLIYETNSGPRPKGKSLICCLRWYVLLQGGSSKSFSHIKKMAFSQPEVLHLLLTKLAENVADYVRYQADNGAQVRWGVGAYAANAAASTAP